MASSPRLYERRLARIALVFLVPLALLLAGELCARVWVAVRWPARRVAKLTQPGTIVGRYDLHPYLPFVLHPEYPGHNELGFRGPSFPEDKPDGVRRLACIGGSTTYGLWVPPEETHGALLADHLREQHGEWDVINAGVPAWTSLDSLLNLQLRVLPLHPDVVVIYQGRNDLLAQGYTGFRGDYSHLRRATGAWAVGDSLHRRLFQASHLFMVLAAGFGPRFGWSEEQGNPVFDTVAWENQPDAEDLIAHLQRPPCSDVYRRNVTDQVKRSQEAGAQVVLCSMAFVASKAQIPEFGEATLREDVRAALRERVDANNQILREVAADCGTAFVDTAKIADREEWFLDECHTVGEAHAERARMIAAVLIPALEGRSE